MRGTITLADPSVSNLCLAVYDASSLILTPPTFVISNERNLGGSEPPAAAVSAATNLVYGNVDGLCNGLFKAILKTNGGTPFGLQVQGGGTSVPYPSIWFVMPAILGLAAIFLLIAWRRVRAVNYHRQLSLHLKTFKPRP